MNARAGHERAALQCLDARNERVDGLDEHVGVIDVNGKKVLKVAPQALTALAERAFTDLAHLLRTSHLESLAKILKDAEHIGVRFHFALQNPMG